MWCLVLILLSPHGSDQGICMTANGKSFVAVLATNERGPILTRRAETRADAFAQARRLLDDAEDREWNRGETVSVEVRQADE